MKYCAEYQSQRQSKECFPQCNSCKEKEEINLNEKYKKESMIPIAKTLQEAINHFLNSDGQICCYSKYGDKICKTLKECDLFFKNKPKKKRNKVRPI